MATNAVARETVFALRREIAKIEGRLPETLSAASSLKDATVLRQGGIARRENLDAFLATGVGGLDRVLGGGLPRSALVEIHGVETRNAGATAGFALAVASLILKASDLPLLWIGTAEIFREAGCPYPPGLVHQFGIAPERLLLSEVPKLVDALWIAEEAAPLSALSAVIIELRGNPDRLDLTATRRLHRRAEQAGRPVFLIRQAAEAEPTAAPVRLLVAPAPAAPRLTLAGSLADSIGRPAFGVSVDKCRSALTGAFIVEWNSHELSLQERRPQDSLRLVPVSQPGEDLAAAPGSVLAFPPREKAAARHQPSRREHAAHRSPRRTG